jgi:hypothetical protein
MIQEKDLTKKCRMDLIRIEKVVAGAPRNQQMTGRIASKSSEKVTKSDWTRIIHGLARRSLQDLAPWPLLPDSRLQANRERRTKGPRVRSGVAALQRIAISTRKRIWSNTLASHLKG